MTAKEFLMQYRAAMRRTQAITEHLKELRAVCEQLKTEDGHKIELDKAVCNLVDAERHLSAEVTQLCMLETEIARTIDRMPEPYRTLLFERYINGKTWERIAVDMHYSYRGVTKMHGRALQAVKECIEVPT